MKFSINRISRFGEYYEFRKNHGGKNSLTQFNKTAYTISFKLALHEVYWFVITKQTQMFNFAIAYFSFLDFITDFLIKPYNLIFD